MLPTLQIGPLSFPLPQLTVLLAIWLGLWLSEKTASRFQISIEALYGLTFSLLIAGLLSARLSYVFQYPGAFIQSPISLVSLNTGLLDPFVGLVFGLLGLLIYVQRAKLPVWNVLDALTPLLAVLSVGLSLAHLASGESFGAPANLPWSIFLWGALRHPVQLYETIAALLSLAVLFAKIKTFSSSGQFFLVFMALTASWHLWLESFHGDSLTILAGVRVIQIISWFVLAVALILLDLRNRQKLKEV